MSRDITEVKFDALRNAIYHVARRNYLDLVNRILNFAVIMLGAGVAGKAASLFQIDGLWLEMGVVVAATVQLTFDFSYRARTHEILQKKYYEMLADIEAETQPDTKRYDAKLFTISADEPMPMRALDALAYNAAVDATRSDPADKAACRLHVPLAHRLLKQIIPFHSHEYGLDSERKSWWARYWPFR